MDGIQTLSRHTCAQCDVTCRTCTGATSGECTECYPGSVVQSGACITKAEYTGDEMFVYVDFCYDCNDETHMDLKGVKRVHLMQSMGMCVWSVESSTH